VIVAIESDFQAFLSLFLSRVLWCYIREFSSFRNNYKENP